jgi:hypothetical protein
MSAPKWLTAAGVAGALVVGGSAVVAVAGDDPSGDPSSASTVSSSPTASPSSTPEASPSDPDRGIATPHTTGTPEAVPDGSGDIISSAEAVEIARRAVTGGGSSPTVEELDLKFEDGRQIWDVEFVGDDEVEVHAVTGEVVKLELGDDDRDDDDNSGPGSGDDDDEDGSGSGRGGHDDGPDDD